MAKKQPKPSIDTIVHLGAGRCSELDTYLNEGAGRIVLVEADTKLAADLRDRTAALPAVEVHEAAVAWELGQRQFHRFNLPELNSLRAPKGLRDLFPGLKEVETVTVDAVTPATLVEPLELEVEQTNRLVVDVPGVELPVLRSLKQSDLLHRFQEITLHCGRSVLYEGGKPADKVVQWLRDQGFDPVSEDLGQDPERPCYRLRRNAMQLTNRELKSRVEELAAALREQERMAADRGDQIERLREAKSVSDEQLAKREAELQNAVRELDEKAALVEELRGRLTQANKEQADHERQATEWQAKIEQLIKARDDHLSRANEGEAKVEQLTREREQLRSSLTQTEKAQADLERQMAGWQAKFEELRQARDQQAALAGNRQTKLEELTRKIDEKHAQIEQMRAQLEAAAKENVAHKEQVEQAAEQVKNLAHERSEQAALAEESGQQVQTLTNQLAESKKRIEELQSQLESMNQNRHESEYRQRLLDDELVKAEAQIELIKDVLLSDKAL